MKLHIYIKDDLETNEKVIEKFTCVPNDKYQGTRLLPVTEVMVDASTVPQSFYTEWFNYKVNRLGNPVLEWSHLQYLKHKTAE